ncbi:hypothetical protein AB1Y20_005800 [Prymnesium parvum]|uniref:Uncharacterized protein n=1 Tax=Prymnesium parvum TaxID=97485 RepID=A0AB34J284_PRYPA
MAMAFVCSPLLALHALAPLTAPKTTHAARVLRTRGARAPPTLASSSIGTPYDGAAPHHDPTLTSRRALLALLALAPSWPAAAARPSCKTSSNPSITVVTCNDFGVQPDGRLLGCDADEACIASGAVRNPSKFAPPWSPDELSPEAKDLKRAWRSLVDAVATESGMEVVTADEANLYLRASGAAKVPAEGTDDLEFLLISTNSGPTALFRSATRQRVFVYPLQQPIPNQDSHRDRLNAIRAKLGWRELGYAGELQPERSSVSQVENFFGLRLRGVSVPEDYDE